MQRKWEQALTGRPQRAELSVGHRAKLVPDKALQLIQRLPADHHEPHQVGAVVLFIEGPHRRVGAQAPRLSAPMTRVAHELKA